MSVSRQHAPAAPLLVALAVSLAVPLPARAAPAAATAAATETGVVALLPVLGSGLALDELTAVDALLQREVDARFAGRSVSGALVRERLDEGARRGLRCDRSLETCQAQLGLVCQADLVLVASLVPVRPAGADARADARIALALRLVDVVEASQVAHTSVTLPGLPTAVDLRRALARLDEPDARRALLVVTGPSGAPVVVDGAPRGSLPLPGPIELAPGAHDVVVHGEPVHSARVEVRRGERAEVRAPVPPVPAEAPADPLLAEGPPPDPPGPPASGAPAPLESGPFPSRVVALGGGTALAVGGGAAFIVGVVQALAYNDAKERLLVAEAGTDVEALRRDPGAVAAVRADYEESYETWTTWGPWTVGAGMAALVVGATVVAVGALALE